VGRIIRCGARTRIGTACRSPVVHGKRRCRMHGGAEGSGAPLGNKNAFRHGHYAAEAIADRRALAELIRLTRASLVDVGKREQKFRNAWGCSLIFAPPPRSRSVRLLVHQNRVGPPPFQNGGGDPADVGRAGCLHKVIVCIRYSFSIGHSSTCSAGHDRVQGSPPRPETPSMSLFTSRRPLPSGISRAIKAFDTKSTTMVGA
jgi:hypothetical protein